MMDPRSIELSVEQRRCLAELSEKSGKPWPTVFSEALASYKIVKENVPISAPEETFNDGAVRAGRLVSIDDAPPDLSTNPKYMEGFGQNGPNPR